MTCSVARGLARASHPPDSKKTALRLPPTAYLIRKAVFPKIGPPFKGDGRVRDERCREIPGSQFAGWPVRATLLARLARPSSLKGGPKEGAQTTVPATLLARWARPSSLKGGPKQGIGPPFQGGRQSEGRTMQGDCWLAVRRLACARHPPGSVGSPVLPQGRTEERRSADDCAGHTPGSVGSPVLPQGRTEARNRSPFQGGWQSEGRTMQGDCWLAVRRLACVRHTPGSRARPSSLEGGKRWCFCRVRLRHISQVPAVVVIAPIGIQIFVLVMKDCGANVDPMPWSIQTTPATIRRPPTIVDALFTVALGSLFCVRLSRKFFGSVGQFEPAGLSPVEFLDERGKPCSDGRRLVGVSAGRFERFRQIVP